MLLGHYGLHRPLYRCDSICVNDVQFKTGHILFVGTDADGFHPIFEAITDIFKLNGNEYRLMCERLHVFVYNHHFHTYEVTHTQQLSCINHEQLKNLSSPWPLIIRTKKEINYISMRHK